MAEQNKNLDSKNKRAEFDIEEDFQDQVKPEQPSEPARSQSNKVAGAVNKDKLNQASAKKI